MLRSTYVALALLAVAGLAQPARAQVMGGLQVTADQWKASEDGGYDWGRNYGVGFRVAGGERKLRGYATLDLMPAGGGPFYYLLTAGAIFGLRGEHEGAWPYLGLGAVCALDYGVNQTGRGICGYQGLGGLRLGAGKYLPYVELQYSLKTNMKRVGLVMGIYTN